ncbi:MAG: hypothetical protein U5K74_13525 [Gemmatimonadaceae bacterium]|nr:hypothetical protein [Gemmatimonadaceae bacterium]
MRLTTRLLLGLVLGVSLLLAAVIAVLDRRLYSSRSASSRSAQLQSEARLLAAQWTDRSQADAIADAAGRATGHRVTLIDTAGTVLGDSDFDPPRLGQLENHLTRPEVRQAIEMNTGQARRMSPSAGDEELYVAVRMPLGISRVSVRTLDRGTSCSRALATRHPAGWTGRDRRRGSLRLVLLTIDHTAGH